MRAGGIGAALRLYTNVVTHPRRLGLWISTRVSLQGTHAANVEEDVEVFYPHLMCSLCTICPKTIATVTPDGLHVLPVEFTLETYVTLLLTFLLLVVLLACSSTAFVLARMIRTRAYVIHTVARPTQAA